MSAAALENLKALIVEDNAHMRALLRSLLSVIGLKNVFEAADGEQAFHILREQQPDMVLTDLSMAPTDGIAFTREIRLSHDSPSPFVPIIMITGHTEQHRVESARDAGVTEFLAKPVTTQNLFLRIAEVVERPRAFVRCKSYFGPDRRRHVDLDYMGPWRREGDGGNRQSA